ncbi:MAG TPA: DUF4254 domain-containing protein [Pirellulaceae bacterium]|nr:DUF4254 domain-containing protein [Pirellulaceae bacterium]
MLDVSSLTQLQQVMVVRWHAQPVDNPCEGLLSLVCQQHGFNFLLWHEEDIARSPEVGDEKIAQVKRAIDRYNQLRNDGIEKLDDWITADLEKRGVTPIENARLNTETPGSTIDRLSILSLRIFHLEEQTERRDATVEHLQSVRQKLAVCRLQHADLSQSLRELLDDIYAGRKRQRTYRALKMYNDPALNPYLYSAVPELKVG